LLDEPFTGIDPVTIDGIQAIVRELRANGISILITDHQVRETLEITDRSYVIRSGRVLCHGRPEEVISHPEARKYYFGDGINLNLPESSPHLRPVAPRVRENEAVVSGGDTGEREVRGRTSRRA
jgi:ABC-type multidrug transport system ATPase subunit